MNKKLLSTVSSIMIVAFLYVLWLFVYMPSKIDPAILQGTLIGHVAGAEIVSANGVDVRNILVKVPFEGVFTIASADKKMGDKVKVDVYERRLTRRNIYELRPDN